MKRRTLLALTAASALLFTACGGNTTDQNGNTAGNATTGVGYYVDAAVEGVHYTCGTQTGVTGAQGKFIFEKGKPCRFEVAGIPLREVSADELVDQKKIVENNATVARFCSLSTPTEI